VVQNSTKVDNTIILTIQSFRKDKIKQSIQKEAHFMQTVITSKFQTTISKKIREKLLLSVKDTLNWEIEDGRIILSPMQTDFLQHKNSVRIGSGDIVEDIQAARVIRAGSYTNSLSALRARSMSGVRRHGRCMRCTPTTRLE
jgi:bifunctional DNA-binding transcriptional regulator/antitoxin component of YhaV-PrlF toxin-antitoxin module